MSVINSNSMDFKCDDGGGMIDWSQFPVNQVTVNESEYVENKQKEKEKMRI